MSRVCRREEHRADRVINVDKSVVRYGEEQELLGLGGVAVLNSPRFEPRKS